MKSLRYSTLDEIDEDILVDVFWDAYRVKDNKFLNDLDRDTT